MNNTIWKHALNVTDVNRIELPKGAELLCVQTQDNIPFLWAQVNNSEAERELHIIETFGTGHLLNGSPRKYLGTYQLHDGQLVFHVYEYLGTRS